MSWAKLCDGYYSHEKTMAASLEANGLYAIVLSWVARHEKDGVCPKHVAQQLARGRNALCEELVSVGFWEDAGDVYRVHNYLLRNPSSKELNRQRKRGTKRKQVSRERHAEAFTRHTPPVTLSPGTGREGISSSSSGLLPNSGDGGVGEGSGFAAFWAAYPRKTHKLKASTEWQRLRPDQVTCAAIQAALGWQVTSLEWIRDGGQYIPHAATYLHQKRWTDEPSEARWTSPKTAGNVAAMARAAQRIQRGG